MEDIMDHTSLPGWGITTGVGSVFLVLLDHKHGNMEVFCYACSINLAQQVKNLKLNSSPSSLLNSCIYLVVQISTEQ